MRPMSASDPSVPPQTAYPAPPPRPSAALAVVSLVAGLVIVALQVALQLVLPLIYSTTGGTVDLVTLLNVIQLVQGMLVALCAIVAVATGLIVLVRRGPGRARAGAGVALGGAALAALVATLLQSVLLSVF